MYASFKATGVLLLSVIVNRIELVRLPFNACAWHGRDINGRYWIKSPGDTSRWRMHAIRSATTEWRQLPENVGKRWITVRAYVHSSRMGPRSARYTEYKFGLSARLNSYQELQHMANPILAYNGALFSKNATARCEVPAGIRHEVFESFLAAKWSI